MARSLAPPPAALGGIKATALAIFAFVPAYLGAADNATPACSAGLALLAVRIAMRDLRSLRVSDLEIVFLGALGLFWAYWQSGGDLVDVVEAGARASAYAVLLWLIRKVYFGLRGRQGLGLGDVKLVAAAGLWLGPIAFASTIVCAACAGLLFAVARSWRKRRALRWTAALPFATLFAPALWCIWLCTALLD